MCVRDTAIARAEDLIARVLIDDTQQQNIHQAKRNNDFKKKGRASIYSHGGIADIRKWFEELQAVLFIVVRVRQSWKHIIDGIIESHTWL